MKKLFVSLLCLVFAQSAFGAEVTNSAKKAVCDQSLISISLSSEFDDDFNEEKKCFIDGINSTDFSDEDKKKYRETGFFGSIASIRYNEKVVGVIVYSRQGLSGHFLIDWIVIDPLHQKSGIGSCALDLFVNKVHATKISLKPASEALEVVYIKKWGFEKAGESCYLTKQFK